MSEGTASNGVDNDKDDERNKVEYGYLSPIVFQRCHNAGFACIAVIAELVLIIAPKPTVRVGGVYRKRSISNPSGGSDKREIARRWRLTTSRLNWR